MKKYNHVFDIAFSVESNNEWENVTADELRAALMNRANNLFKSDDAEVLEACGFVDSYDEGEE